MGEPYFKLLSLIKRHKVTVFSSNYPLYADMSMRVMNIISEFAPGLEVYSIDEAFIDLSRISHIDLKKYARKIKDTIYKGTGLPVCIGIGPTKTLAKAAGYKAKRIDGIFIINSSNREDILKDIDVGDVWGVGRSWSDLLSKQGIKTALQLALGDERWLRRSMSIVGLKTAYELNGISCIPLEEMPQPKKSITVSRSFGKEITDFDELKEAVITFVSRAAEKLRSEQKLAISIMLFVQTNRFNERTKYYSNSTNITLKEPSHYTPHLIAQSIIGLKSIYKKGYHYKRAGVIITDLQDKSLGQISLFNKESETDNLDRDRLMTALDKINKKHGRGSVFYAGSGVTKSWVGKSNRTSRAFTTNWNSLLEVS